MRTDIEKEVTELDELGWMWKVAKQEETEAKERRLKLEEKILLNVPEKEEGTVTVTTGFFKISATYSKDRKVDSDLVPNLPITNDLREKIFRKKFEVSVTELKKIQEYLPDIYIEVAKAITTKPSKPSIKIEELKQ